MKQLEADIIAKAIRNSEISLGEKADICKMICSEMLKQDQFFNQKRFMSLAILELDKGWPNQVDRYLK
jgi:hypothetical protein